MEDNLTLDQRLIEMVRQFENAEEVTRSAREKSEKCRDYFDDKQLTEDEESVLKKRGQPPVVFNEIKPKVKTMLGLEKQTRKDPKAFPRNPDDEDAARAATDAIRFVCDASKWDDVRSKAARELAIEGTGAVMVGVKRTSSGIDPDIRRIAWDRHYADPHSSEDDFSDAAFQGIVIWMDLADAMVKYPDAKEALEATWAQAKDTETYDDKPKWNLWADYTRKRVRLCEHYYRKDGQWMFCIFTQAGFVVAPQPSPYLDEDGEPECPIKAVSLYIDRDNNRYGEVQAMLSPQDEVNKRRSKSLWHASSAQVQAVDENALNVDADEVRKEAARPDGVLPMGWQRVPLTDMFSGNLALMQDAREHIHRTGANSAMAGKDTGGQSGKAIALQQMGGMTEAADYLDCIRRLSLAVYGAVWNRIRQFWQGERWVRVTDNENNVRFVGLNRPVTAIQLAARQLGIEKDNLQQADPRAVQALQAFAMDPRAQQVMEIENNVTELNVDIIVDEGVDTPTVAAEQFDKIASMIGTAPPQLQGPLWEMLIASSALKGKEKLEEALKAPPPQEQQAMGQLQLAGAQAEIENTQADTANKLADAEAKTAQTQIGAIEAGARVGSAPQAQAA